MRTSGTTLECFHDLLEQVGLEHLEKRRQLANILGVEDSAIRRWAKGTSMPVGMSMISLRYYLEYLGYEVSELAKLPEVIHEVARLLAFRVLSLGELANFFGMQDYPDQVLAILRGVRGLSEARKIQFHEVVESYQNELSNALRAVPKLVDIKKPDPKTELFGDLSPKSHVVFPSEKSLPQRVKANVNMRREERFRDLALNLLEFAQYYASPEISGEVRDQLRLVVGQENIFNLKNLLARLCSNKAFSNPQ